MSQNYRWLRPRSGASPPDQRRQVRPASSRSLIYDLERWLRATRDTQSRKSDTATAILYALKLRSALLRYCDDCAIELNHSAAERSLRGVAIDRRICSPRVAYLYRFNWTPAGAIPGAVHRIELPFEFGTAPAFHAAPSWVRRLRRKWKCYRKRCAPRG